MTALPPSADLVNTGITKGTFKTALGNLRAYLSGLFGDDGTQATALSTLGAILGSSVGKSGAYTVVAGDRGKLIDCTGAGGWTLAVTACATLGAGFAFAVRNSTTGTITINPNLSEPVDDATTLDLAPGETCFLQVNAAATGLKTVGRMISANGSYRSVQVFTASGTYTKPAGLKRVRVTVVGGGGGSGGTAGYFASSGGGGGGAAIKTLEASALASSVTVTVGAAGTAGSSGTGSGGAGGTTSFGAHCSATGGAGSLGGTNMYAGGDGGVGTGGDLNFNGCAGDMPDFYQDLGGDQKAFASGDGGASLLGVGGKSQITAVGNDGKAYGGGAGGSLGAGASRTGAAGAAGVVYVEEFF